MKPKYIYKKYLSTVSANMDLNSGFCFEVVPVLMYSK